MSILKIALVAVSLFISSYSFANPPGAIHGSYDPSRRELHATVEHIVTNRLVHFVKEITIYHNGKEIKRTAFDFQTSRRNQTIPPTEINAYPGDVIKIAAICNVGGSYEKVLNIE